MRELSFNERCRESDSENQTSQKSKPDPCYAPSAKGFVSKDQRNYENAVRRGTAQKKAVTAKEVDADVVIDIGQQDGQHMNQPRQADEAAALPGAQQIAPIVR